MMHSEQEMETEAVFCYLCGKELTKGEVTRDHVPPRGLFPRPLPSDLITVPCCKPCNNGKSREEEFFRLIATLGVTKTPEAKSVYNSRTLPHTLVGKRLKNEVKQLLQTLQHVWMEIDDVIQPIPTMRIPVRTLCTVVERIGRGLTAHFHPSLPVHKLFFEAYIPKRSQLLEVFALLAEDLTEVRIGGRTFHAYHGTAIEDERIGVWIMTFHEMIPAVVFHFSSDHPELSASRKVSFAVA